MTIEEIQKLPVGTTLILPGLELEVILGEEDFDEFFEYLGRWITGTESNEEEGTCYLASYDELTKFVLVSSN
jgi:hypothetical protein